MDYCFGQTMSVSGLTRFEASIVCLLSVWQSVFQSAAFLSGDFIDLIRRIGFFHQIVPGPAVMQVWSSTFTSWDLLEELVSPLSLRICSRHVH